MQYPSDYFDLSGWKLQITGLADIENLTGHSSTRFYLDQTKRHISFYTPSARSYGGSWLRSELRHMAQFGINDLKERSLRITTLVKSRARPNQVTVAQIHSKADFPTKPLLRVYYDFDSGYICSAWKMDATGENTSHFSLAKIQIRDQKIAIYVKAGVVDIWIDGRSVKKFSARYWTLPCHFKTGCYPQGESGSVEVFMSRLMVNV